MNVTAASLYSINVKKQLYYKIPTWRKVWVIMFQRFVQNSVGVVLLVRGESNNGGVAYPFIFSPNELISKLNFNAK